VKQIPLNFKHETEYLENDFIISSSNIDAYKWINTKWNSNFLCIYGEIGKTHLAHIWADKNSAEFLHTIEDVNQKMNNLVIDNADKITNEIDFFHLYNIIKEENKLLLLTAKEPPSKWNIKLPDLCSRLNSIPAIKINPPDDKLLKALLIKHFSDRQLKVGDNIIKYIITRIERSFDSVLNLVEKLDKLSLNEKRNITIPLVKQIINLDEL